MKNFFEKKTKNSVASQKKTIILQTVINLELIEHCYNFKKNAEGDKIMNLKKPIKPKKEFLDI